MGDEFNEMRLCRDMQGTGMRLLHGDYKGMHAGIECVKERYKH